MPDNVAGVGKAVPAPCTLLRSPCPDHGDRSGFCALQAAMEGFEVTTMEESRQGRQRFRYDHR
ncbi:MAG: hypothetical protein ACLR6J_03980 [Parabacteroides merdae]